METRKELRPHQQKAIEQLRSSLAKGFKRVVIQAPTGFGKTLVAAKLVEGALGKGNRVIFTAPQKNLIEQTVARFEDEGITDVGVMQANHVRTDPAKPVQIASLQTLARRDIPHAGLVIVDECHIRSPVIESMMAERPNLVFVGLSATPWRKGMGLWWQDLVTPISLAELIDQDYLSKFKTYAPDVPDLKGVRSHASDFVLDALAEYMGDAKLVGNAVETWLAHGEDRPTLCFGVNRAHAALLKLRFEAHGVASAYVDGKTDMVERDLIARQFKAGGVRVICSVRTMTTGVDLPVGCIVDCAPTKSAMLHVQKIGRGLRINPGTEDCLILDHSGNSLRLGLVTDIFCDRLDTNPPSAATSDTVRTKEAKPCVKCAALHSKPVCPVCGHVKKPPSGEIESVDGELVQIGGAKKAFSREDKQRFWSMALWLDRERGRGGKLAKGLYKGKFGVWPNGLFDQPVAADAAFMSYEKSRRIAYAKRMSKMEGK